MNPLSPRKYQYSTEKAELASDLGCFALIAIAIIVWGVVNVANSYFAYKTKVSLKSVQTTSGNTAILESQK